MSFEIIGITLAYIEIRYKPLADRIELTIKDNEHRIKLFIANLSEKKFFAGLIVIFITVIFFVGIPYLAGFFDRIITREWVVVKEVLPWVIFTSFGLFVLAIGFISLADFVSWLNRFSNGHAIGALGVVVTSIGLMGDAYQAITILIR